jgi:hypothetical protein
MNPDHVGPKLLHLPEIFFDLGPFLLPIVLQQKAILVVIVVEAPGDIGCPVVQHEGTPVVCNPHPPHFLSRCPVYGDADDDQERGEAM